MLLHICPMNVFGTIWEVNIQYLNPTNEFPLNMLSIYAYFFIGNCDSIQTPVSGTLGLNGLSPNVCLL